MQQTVINKISESLRIDPKSLSAQTRIKDIAKDSIDIIEIIAVLSHEFKVPIKSAELNNIETIQDIIGYIEKNQGQ